jgi:hypothetical protein
VSDAVVAWTQAWSGTKPRLIYWSAPDFIQIYDSRHPGREGTYTFEGTLARVYQAVSDRAMSAAAVRRRLDLPWRWRTSTRSSTSSPRVA